MKNSLSPSGLVLFLVLIQASFAGAQNPIHHDLEVVLYPEEKRLTVIDTLTMPQGHPLEVEFFLHAGLNPFSATQGVRIVKEKEGAGSVPVESFRVVIPEGVRSFAIEYGGVIYHPIEQHGEDDARGIEGTPGMISGEGVYLSESSLWYPKFGEEMVSFKQDVKLPAGWDAVSQGKRIIHTKDEKETTVRWESPEPQAGIFLVAAPFTEYVRKGERIEAMAFLRSPDEELAAKYIEATESYIAMYEKLIGPYPYAKFALVENFWETGFGMPSFTLLGPKVIRFPFIVNTSYPHEILHNWWGNSVFPEYEKGNWSEGLTAYLADHLMRERQGDAVEYRLATLQKYADYVLSERDFPLTEFRSRHSSSSEAIGYGKSLMFFHMLRRKLGDKVFSRALQDFYEKYKFRFASFDDLRMSFETVSGKKMGEEFDQWIRRRGAPQISVSGAEVTADGDTYILRALIEQTQPGDTYYLHIPLAVTMEERNRAHQSVVEMKDRRLDLELRLPAKPLRLDVDPEFDIFRRLDREEIPPALSQTLGAKKMLVILPSCEGEDLIRGYRELSSVLAHAGPDEVEIKLDTELKELPSDRAVTLMGWENHFLEQMSSSLSAYEVNITGAGVRIGQKEIKRENHSVVLTARNRKNRDASLTWIASELPGALPGLGRKLPHYHKYSYLGFDGDEPVNRVKGRWPVLDSPMSAFLLQDDGKIQRIEMGELEKREPLASP